MDLLQRLGFDPAEVRLWRVHQGQGLLVGTVRLFGRLDRQP
ncbi:hypothetical protein ACQEVF_22805 [Nonomuraea polychroma]